jgi:hypothetical protein
MARLNEANSVSSESIEARKSPSSKSYGTLPGAPTDAVGLVKRRFVRQNREIARSVSAGKKSIL